MSDILNIYKTDDWTAIIITDESGVVLDCEIIVKPMTDLDRRIRERQRTPRYLKNKRTFQATHFDEKSLALEI